ncbi:hypothetical protein [uncultured Actinomyces sp.]|jgi:hypothetical protein|nr:hypothetical protein [uncultured Actinomyces sp.]
MTSHGIELTLVSFFRMFIAGILLIVGAVVSISVVDLIRARRAGQ